MASLVKFLGLILLVLVGYHYINEPLGFSVAGSIATVIFAICLMAVYRGYRPDGRNGVGWLLISLGCLTLALFDGISIFLLMPLMLIVAGYRLAELPFDPTTGGGSGGGDISGGGADLGGDGCGGD